MIINKTINKVINNTDSESEALLDLTADTVAPENLLLNKTAHNRDGEGIVGEMNEGGTSDYDELQNRPSINSHILTGNKTGSQLGLQNRVLASTLNIGGQTIGNVEGALSALNESKSDLVNGKVPVNELPVYQPIIGSIQSIGGMLPPSNPGDEDKYFRADGTWAKPSGGGGGVSDYDDLSNRPKINNVTLTGNKTGSDLGLQNIVLSSTMTIGGQTITEVEPALHALNNKPSGSGGSKIYISTNESTLHGKTVTITGTSETKTATFDNNGVAEIDGFMETGTATITATDGTETATSTLTIPYYGNYTATLSFWSATLSISTDSPELYGQTITVKDSNNQTVATSVFSGQGTATATVNSTGIYTVSATGDGVTVNESVTVSAQTTYNVSLHLWTATVSISTSSSDLYGATITVKKGGSTVGTTSFSAQGSATYKAHETGEYTFECTYGGQTYSDSVTVSAETSYSATINTGLILSAWLTAGNVTGTYADFSEVEADKKAVRKLMTIHAAVDYLATCASATDSLALSIINSDICAKWINLRDYALDTLYDNTYLAAMMYTADKYFYGEWVITDSTTTPATWGAKGNVPIMTGNSAPYGTASAYQVFDGNFSTTASGTDFSYKFTNPVCVKAFYCNVNGGTLQGSNDGSTYTDIATPLSNTAFYLYYRVHFASSQTVHTIQFYGRELKEEETTQPTDGRIYEYLNSKYYTENWSEYDWDTTNPRHYIYDHGVELETLLTQVSTGFTAIKNIDHLYEETNTTTYAVAAFYKQLDFTNYNLACARIDLVAYNNQGSTGAYIYGNLTAFTAVPDYSAGIASLGINADTINANSIQALDITSVNGTNSIAICTGNAASAAKKKITVNEWWLE